MTDQTLSLLAKHALKFVSSSLINYQPVRTRIWTNVRPITGWPRKHLYLKRKKYPEAHKYNWRPYLPDDGQYTTRPLPIFKMAGRDIETGRVVVRTLGGGNPKKFRWVDMIKQGNPDGSPKEEVVLQIKYDPLNTPKLALVANSEIKRWIFAPEGAKVGDIIKTYTDLPRNPVRPKDGDSHPVGALPAGTKINQVEIEPGAGAKFCLAAGSCAEIVKRSVDSVTIKLPHGDQFKIEPNCMAVVGNMSNVGHRDVLLWCPQRKRWLGKRPRSGQWHRKDGYCGRKIYPPKFFDLTLAALREKHAKQTDKDSILGNFDI